MYKHATFKEKFADLHDWVPFLVESVKKDLKNEHLKKDPFFVKKYLDSKNINKLENDDLSAAYQQAIQQEEKGEELAEFIASRWLLKNSELYEFFENHLSEISADFTELEEIQPEHAKILIEKANQVHGSKNVYLFSVLNSVVFPKESFEQLKNQAKQDQEKEEKNRVVEEEQMNSERTQQSFEIEKSRLIDKYEKKLAGLNKKYVLDTTNLKKQIAQLQRKLNQKET